MEPAVIQIWRSFLWPLLSSVMAVDSPIMTVCQDASPTYKACPVSADWSVHICSGLHQTRSRLPPQRIMGIWVPCHWGWQQNPRRILGRIDWKYHSNKRGQPKAQSRHSKPESILLSVAFLWPPFASLLLRFSVLSERGAPSSGPHHSLPIVPKEAEPNTKAAVIAILHRPLLPWKPHFNLKCPLPTSACPTFCGQWRVGVGHCGIPLMGRGHGSTSSTYRMRNMRTAAEWISSAKRLKADNIHIAYCMGSTLTQKVIYLSQRPKYHVMSSHVNMTCIICFHDLETTIKD